MSISAPTNRLFKTHHDLDQAIREKMVTALNSTLATLIDLKYQVKQAHWNVKGPQFYQLHELFDTLAGEVEGYVDLVAERATTLGGYAYGTIRDSAQHSILPEYPDTAQQGQEHLHLLVDRYAIVAKHIRMLINKADEAGDKDTADLFTEISRGIDLRLWFLESHLV